ncbi:toll/interleukin-1 receptor domain-containing protein [Pengzhenrongella frigida]|uniref:TIR domain-containing protein n=1 Tax=Pengzhenrongella frigida TaxID=1259133 RepID=A0A4Q5MV74_9MICO|nr:toll/interleukin-1 receptor domain-containing protein [Cellulomonas sp. HLT2-17]RYV49410.1 TIR domain-containing protein [Cellulomonas sp. HLT2-17]
MAIGRTSVFWSYAHEDDANSHGAILRLRDDLADAYSLLSGTSIEIFVDRESIDWGAVWKRGIDSALSEASFLIPIMTPRYFTRPECRRELLEFYAQAKRSDLMELVLPLLYMPIADFSEDNSEEAIRIASTLQYIPWTTLCLLDNTDVKYRKAVHDLAARLHELLESVATTQLERERVAVKAPDTVEEDLAGLLGDAERMWPDWLEAVFSDEIRKAQVSSIQETFNARRRRLRHSRAAATVINGTYQQQAAAELPLAKQYLADAETYSARTIELDPVIRAVCRAAESRPAATDLLLELREKVANALAPIREIERARADGFEMSLRDFIEEMPYVTQTWKEIQRLVTRGEALVIEANAIVTRWVADIDALL